MLNQGKKTKGERTADIVVDPCDQGQHGSSYCGECNHDISDLDPMPDACPNCHIKFNWGIVVAPGHGGSDF